MCTGQNCILYNYAMYLCVCMHCVCVCVCVCVCARVYVCVCVSRNSYTDSSEAGCILMYAIVAIE